MPLTYRPCPICGTDDTQLCLDNPMAAVGGFDMSYTVVRCKNCGFHYAKQLPSEETFRAYYDAVSKYDAPGTVSPVDRVRIEATVRFLNGRIEKSARIADLGCGYGALLSRLKAAGWQQLQGIDPAPNAAQCALEMFGVHGIQRGMMSDADLLINLKEVDLICIMCVLEHLPNMREDMTRLLAKLRPGCKVLVEVPAIEFFDNPEGEPFGEFSLEHIQYFDAPSLNNLMRSLGAEPIALALLDLPMVASGSMLGLFQWTGSALTTPSYQRVSFDALAKYIVNSKQRLTQALQRVEEGPLIIYGAGSHTARLMPFLERKSGCKVQSIVDNNPNLIGKPMGRWTVQSPVTIRDTPEVPVLVSSFRSQNAIAAQLKRTTENPLVLMYD